MHLKIYYQLLKQKILNFYLLHFFKLLKPGGRAAVIVPDGVLFKDRKANKGIVNIIDDQN